MSFDIIFTVITKIGLMIALGYLLRKLNIVSESLQKGLSDILLKAVLPLAILSSANYAYSRDLFYGMLIAAAAATVFYVVGLVSMTFLSKTLSLPDKERKIFVTMTVFANTGFV